MEEEKGSIDRCPLRSALESAAYMEGYNACLKICGDEIIAAREKRPIVIQVNEPTVNANKQSIEEAKEE